jgi:hypothetical protein
MSLKERAAAGLVTRYRAGRCHWYVTRHAARHIRDARPYPAGGRVFRLQAPPRGRPDTENAGAGERPATRGRLSPCELTAGPRKPAARKPAQRALPDHRKPRTLRTATRQQPRTRRARETGEGGTPAKARARPAPHRPLIRQAIWRTGGLPSRTAPGQSTPGSGERSPSRDHPAPPARASIKLPARHKAYIRGAAQ